jgi:hypothetical protein
MQIRYPVELKARGRKFYAAVLKDFDPANFGPHDYQLLAQAGTCLDVIAEAEDELKKTGSYFIDRWGQPKQHPAHAVIRDNKIIFARLCRELNLSSEKPEDSRPPPLYNK